MTRWRVTEYAFMCILLSSFPECFTEHLRWAEAALECHKIMGNKVCCQSIVNLRCHWSVWGARSPWNSFISRFPRVFPISHKRHWLWGHDDTLHWEMVSEAYAFLNTSHELISQVLSPCWKWQEGQEDSGCPGAEAGDPAWVSLPRSGQTWYCYKESWKVQKEQK